jgi:uncharacterized protein YyaL (SSP411 family)
MRMSEWLRQYQLTGIVPETHGDDTMLPFWAGWMYSVSQQGTAVTPAERLEMAIKAAEFIEDRARS